MTRSYEDSPWGPLGGSRTNRAHGRDWPANKGVAMGQTTREKPKEQRRVWATFRHVVASSQ